MIVAISQSPDARWRGHVQPGLEMPLNASAAAKAIMAHQSEALVAEALSHDLPLLTANTRNDRDGSITPIDSRLRLAEPYTAPSHIISTHRT